MAGLYDGLEEAAFFKRADGGYIYGSPNPWLFGPSVNYVVTDADKAAIANRIRETLRAEKIAGHVNAIGSLATLFFTSDPVNNYSDAKKSSTKRYSQYFRNTLERGVFLAPSQFEASFVSVSHTESDIESAIKAAQESLRQIATS